jgi:uncharacterized protein YndB with AHSA1/START domain
MTSAPPVTITTPGDREIRVERIFNASRERVWQALTDPARIAQWWSPSGTQLEIERFEPHRGGWWRFVERQGDGSTGFGGRYREVTAPERLVYSFEWDGMPGHVMIHTVTLEAIDVEQTRMVTVVLCHTEEECQGVLHSGMDRGFTRQYVALDQLLAAGASQ